MCAFFILSTCITCSHSYRSLASVFAFLLYIVSGLHDLYCMNISVVYLGFSYLIMFLFLSICCVVCVDLHIYLYLNVICEKIAATLFLLYFPSMGG